MSGTKTGSKAEFLRTVKKGDILITKSMKQVAGLVGHAAIMATDYWVLEMPGGAENEGSSSSSSFSFGSLFSFYGSGSSSSNNRRISKDNWYDLHLSDYINVYRCPDSSAASKAADWAYTNYYNSAGGDQKTIHISYSLVSPIFPIKNPSYCSKLVLQSYVYGPGSAVINPIILIPASSAAIVPTTIPSYFLPEYTLTYKGRF